MFKAMFALNGPSMAGGSGSPDWWLAALFVLALIVVFGAPNTHELFSRYRVAIRPEAKDLFSTSPLAWRANLPWLMMIAAVGGIACFYQAEFPQFLYWGF